MDQAIKHEIDQELEQETKQVPEQETEQETVQETEQEIEQEIERETEHEAEQEIEREPEQETEQETDQELEQKTVQKPDQEKIEAAIEAILFTMGNSVEAERIAKALEITTKQAERILHKMMERYQAENRGIQIIELEQAYQLCTKKEYYEYLIKIAKQPQRITLTDVVLETLSIIAYKQPVTKMEIEKIRGVKCDHAVNKLVEYNLIKELGRLDAPGRPLLFGTTEEFLRHFGVQSLEELPSLNPIQMEDFKAEAEEEVDLKLKV